MLFWSDTRDTRQDLQQAALSPAVRIKSTDMRHTVRNPEPPWFASLTPKFEKKGQALDETVVL